MKTLLLSLILTTLFAQKEYIGTGYLVSVDNNITKTMEPEKVDSIVENNLNIEFDVEQVLDSVKSIEFYVEGKFDIYIEAKDVYMKNGKLIYRKK